MLDIREVSQRVKRLEERFQSRDARMENVRQVRAGRMSGVFPEFFAGETEMPVVANFIDVVARDLSEAIAPLPALNCSSGVITNDRARKFAARRQRVGSYYWASSHLNLQMFGAADNYVTNGFVAAQVEPDFESCSPKIRFMDTRGCYPELNQDGECIAFARKWSAKASRLAAVYPEWDRTLMSDQWGRRMDADLEVVKYVDADQTIVYVPTRGNLVLERIENELGECPIVVAVRPTPDGEMHGQFDDVLGIQAARALFMRLALEAAEKQVQAPIAVPDDVVEIPLGPDAMLRSQTPQNIQRVRLDVGDSTFREMASLNQDLMTGARFPEGRIGNSNASVITGRGVEALMGGYDSQIKTAQIVFAVALQKLTSLCFKMDETLWPNKEKKIRGTVEGTPFDEDYVPAKDIRGDHTCDVTYGFLAGMDPNRALVFLLQLRGDRLIDRATVQRQMPFDVDVAQLQQNVDTEEMRDALKQGMLAYVQSIGPMAQMGQDPSKVLRILAAAIKGRQQGKPLEDLLSDEFETLAAEEAERKQAEAQAMMEQLAGAGVPGAAGALGGEAPGMDDSGLLEGVAPGQAGMGPGGRPSVQMLMAGLGSDGSPNLRAGVRRQIAA